MGKKFSKAEIRIHQSRDNVKLAKFLKHLYHSTNDRSISFDFHDCAEGHDDSWNKQRTGRQSAKMKCMSVFILVVFWPIVKKKKKGGRCFWMLFSKRTPPSFPSATPPEICHFQSWQQWRRAGKEKGMIVLVGATGLLWTQPVLSLDLWPVLLLGSSFGEVRQLGERWGADGQLGQFGEKERKSREWEHKRKKWERQREVSVLWKSGEVERGAEGSRGDRGPWSSIASLSPLLLCVSRDEGMTHSSTHRQTVWESTRRVADACSLCPCYSATAKTVCACERENVVVIFFLVVVVVLGGLLRLILHSPNNTWVGGYGHNPYKLTLDTRLENTGQSCARSMAEIFMQQFQKYIRAISF